MYQTETECIDRTLYKSQFNSNTICEGYSTFNVLLKWIENTSTTVNYDCFVQSF